jgi:hypothetical protein
MVTWFSFVFCFVNLQLTVDVGISQRVDITFLTEVQPRPEKRGTSAEKFALQGVNSSFRHKGTRDQIDKSIDIYNY